MTRTQNNKGAETMTSGIKEIEAKVEKAELYAENLYCDVRVQDMTVEQMDEIDAAYEKIDDLLFDLAVAKKRK
jgi:trans-2-enoyl-CoA reductase